MADEPSDPLAVECPVCDAPPGETCWTPQEYPRDPHARRIHTAGATWHQLALELEDG
jgi:hypothetical protein